MRLSTMEPVEIAVQNTERLDTTVNSPTSREYLKRTADLDFILPSYDGFQCNHIYEDWPCWDLKSSTKQSAGDSKSLTVDFASFCTTAPQISVCIESFTLGDMPPSVGTQQKIPLADSTSESPKKYAIMCDVRSRIMSESSVDSDDTGFIVFEDPSHSNQCSDYEEYESSSSDEEEESDEEESEDEELEKQEFEDEEEEFKTDCKVRFDVQPTVHTMIQWNFAYRAARKGPWEEMARDRERFRGRINKIGEVLKPILLENHRDNVYKNRFVEQEC